jgi:hypothetical protein
VYRGTHSGGGMFCLTVSPDWSRVSTFHAEDIPGDRCKYLRTGLLRRHASADQQPEFQYDGLERLIPVGPWRTGHVQGSDPRRVRQLRHRHAELERVD